MWTTGGKDIPFIRFARQLVPWGLAPETVVNDEVMAIEPHSVEHALKLESRRANEWTAFERFLLTKGFTKEEDTVTPCSVRGGHETRKAPACAGTGGTRLRLWEHRH